MQRRLTYAVVALFAARAAAAQVRVGTDSATRLQRFGRDALYGTAEGLGFAAFYQMRDQPDEWSRDWNGYGKRAASNVGEFLIQEGVTEGMAAVMKRPLDYTRCRCRGTFDRAAWALKGAVTDRLPDGSHPLAVPRILGAYTGAFAQAAWSPSSGDRARVIVVNGTTSLAIGALINLFHEFRH